MLACPRHLLTLLLLEAGPQQKGTSDSIPLTPAEDAPSTHAATSRLSSPQASNLPPTSQMLWSQHSFLTQKALPWLVRAMFWSLLALHVSTIITIFTSRITVAPPQSTLCLVQPTSPRTTCARHLPSTSQMFSPDHC